MKILFKTRRVPGVTAEQIVAARLREASAVWQLVAQGVVREIHYSPDGPAVIGLLEADSLEAAQAVMDALPMAREGLIGFDFFRLLPYDQFGLLFRDEFK